MKLNYDQRKKEFVDMDINEKFLSRSSLKFSDGTYSYTWFQKNKNIIINASDTLSLEIKKQYYYFKIYIISAVNIKFQKKIKEFASNDNRSKFYSFSKEYFEDGTNMYYWFEHYKKSILSSKDEISKKIQNQYFECGSNKDCHLSYDKKLQEFIKEKQLNKFNQYNKDVRFSDNSIMGMWFNVNKEDILNYNNTLKNQYSKYRFKVIERHDNNTLNINERVLEFLNQLDYNKFNKYTNLKFSDGYCMGMWFHNMIDIILNSRKRNLKAIRDQYFLYLNSKDVDEINNKIYTDLVASGKLKLKKQG